MAARATRSHLSHWGAFDAVVEGERLVAIEPFEHDPDPSPVLGNIAGSVRHPTRVAQPMVRAGWLDQGPGPSDKRGAEPFVAVSWERVGELLAGELKRVYGEHGAPAVYGGSYGWASAGRFHHAQSQLHRFLNTLGGYTYSVNSYSHGAGGVILPHVLSSTDVLHYTGSQWRSLVDHTDLFVCFGGMPLKNGSVTSGGVFRHRTRGFLEAAAERGVQFVLFSPLRDDLADFLGAEWHAVSPGSDVAVMLALAHTLITEDLHDRAFLERYCVGFERLERYILGLDDGLPKSPEWAAGFTDVPADAMRALARRMAAGRTFVTTTWSLQRNEYGEQPPWMAVALAAMLGQIGLPGGGFGFGYGSTQRVGEGHLPNGLGLPGFSQGRNPVESFIPVARISDMLLNPGEPFDYNGGRYSYPDIRLVYWSGGNPFHHHQHLGRLRRAFSRPDTIVVHDPFWTAAARHADIVIPCTMTLERNDIGGSHNDAYLAAMQQALPPFEQSRNEYDVFSDLAAELGAAEAFTEGRDEMGWLRYMYETWRERAARVPSGRGHRFPDFDGFWEEGYIELPFDESEVLFSAFRADPQASPLETPSGRIELFSETIAGFGYDDCLGHPAWFAPQEWLGGERAREFPLLMIANNPRTRLHSQLDVGGYSQDSKVQGREPLRLHPHDAAVRGITDGDVVRVYNDRGSFLAGVVVSEEVRPSIVQISTGAWYDPLDPFDVDSMCVHGNPNAVTLDRGSSKLAQGTSGQHALVQIERWDAPLPPIKVLEPPANAPAGPAQA
jgi:biotin/methionine sulfoxide reductase